MKVSIWKCVDNTKNHKAIINWYMILTVVGTLLPFVLGASVSPDLVYLVGNRSVLWNPFLGALLAADIRNLDAFCLAGTPCILLELPVDQMMPGWEGTVSEMIDCGYLPIIAHPERYAYVQRDIGIAHAMCDIGCELQVDACGLMAGLFGAERKTARKLLSEGLVSYIASDAHRPSDYDDYEKARRTFKAEWPGRSRLEDLLREKGKEKSE